MLILDSNSFLWMMLGETRFERRFGERLQRERPLGLSVATPWELWIKIASGKLPPPPTDIGDEITGKRLQLLPIGLEDARRAASLPLLHRDPFDRMIVAQALNREATLVTSDRRLAEYGVQILLV